MVEKAAQAKMSCVVIALIALIASAAFFGCAPQERDLSETGENASAVKGEDAQDNSTQGVAFTWTAESDCAMCHDKEASSQQDSACTASQHADLTCATCHADEAGLVAAHEGAEMGSDKAASALVTTSVDDAVCQSCHDQAELATKTAECTVLTDSEGTVVNPHQLPENEDHAATECISCHKMHSTTAVDKTATRYCKSCHHTDVYSCYTCHA
ncbi:cytochrome c3 family protein [Eggerthellaceae bacterium 3-80]|nr:hypothetical protein D7W09_00670 [bacterium D16-34]